jgi:hypothetical protein
MLGDSLPNQYGLGFSVHTGLKMSDLHEARDPERKSQIDTVGWLFLAFALASVTAAAAMVAYKANDTMVANVSRDLVRVNLFEGVPKYPDRCEC